MQVFVVLVLKRNSRVVHVDSRLIAAQRGGTRSGITKVTNPRVAIHDPTIHHLNGILSSGPVDYWIPTITTKSASRHWGRPFLSNDLGAGAQRVYGSNSMQRSQSPRRLENKRKPDDEDAGQRKRQRKGEDEAPHQTNFVPAREESLSDVGVSWNSLLHRLVKSS